MKKHTSVYKVRFIKDQKLTDIEEFCLFSKYKFSIIANSTFSLLSSFLSYNRSINVAPKIWLKGRPLDKKKIFQFKVYLSLRPFFKCKDFFETNPVIFKVILGVIPAFAPQ